MFCEAKHYMGFNTGLMTQKRVKYKSTYFWREANIANLKCFWQLGKCWIMEKMYKSNQKKKILTVKQKKSNKSKSKKSCFLLSLLAHLFFFSKVNFIFVITLNEILFFNEISNFNLSHVGIAELYCYTSFVH